MKKTLLFITLAATTIVGCKKVDAPNVSAEISQLKSTYNLFDTLDVNITSEANLTNVAWKIDDELIGDSSHLTTIFSKAGNCKLSLTAQISGNTISKEFAIKVIPASITTTPTNEMYVSSIYELKPAPGQFTNQLNTPKAAMSLLGASSMISLGAWGGYVVYGFNKTVINEAGNDLLVKGNALTTWAEPGIVFVMKDENKNGLPDDTWYELAGSETGKGGYIRNYAVTYFRPDTLDKAANVKWTDNQGNSGYVLKNAFHAQSYFPSFIKAKSYTIKGTLLPSTNLNKTNPRMITNMPFEWGYADNNANDEVDIENAIDLNGNKVPLSGIDFIKVQTGIMADGGWLGELSTEITAIKNLHMAK